MLAYDDTVEGINFQSEVATGLHYVTLTAVPEASAFFALAWLDYWLAAEQLLAADVRAAQVAKSH